MWKWENGERGNGKIGECENVEMGKCENGGMCLTPACGSKPSLSSRVG